MGIFSKNTENKLNNLLQKSYDAEQGFKKASENVNNENLKNYFANKANERCNFRVELRKELLDNGCDINETNGSLTATAHRAWMDTKSFFSSNNEESMLEEVKNGEKAAISDYDDILENNQLPPTTENLLQEHRNLIQYNYNKADYLEEIL